MYARYFKTISVPLGSIPPAPAYCTRAALKSGYCTVPAQPRSVAPSISYHVSFVGLCHSSTWPAARTHDGQVAKPLHSGKAFFFKKNAYAGFAGNGHPTLRFPSPFPSSSGLPDPDEGSVRAGAFGWRHGGHVSGRSSWFTHNTPAAQARLAQLRHAFPAAAAGPVADGPRPQNAGRNAVADASLEATLRRLSFRSAMAGPHCFPNCVGGFRPNSFGLGHHQPRKGQTGFERTAGSANAVSHQTS